MSSRKQQYEPIKVLRHLQLLSSLCHSILANNLLLSWQNCRGLHLCWSSSNAHFAEHWPPEKQPHRKVVLPSKIWALFNLIYKSGNYACGGMKHTLVVWPISKEGSSVPAFNLEVHFLTILSWLIIAGDKKTAQISSVWLQHSLLFHVYFFFKGINTLCFFSSWVVILPDETESFPSPLLWECRSWWRRAAGYE